MKFYTIATVMAIFFSSCLTKSIPDAMLSTKDGQGSNTTATMRYEVNGNPVTIAVTDADNQNPGYYTLSCSKSSFYILSGVSNSGEITFMFYTDSLSEKNYRYDRMYGEMFFLDYNGTAEYVAGPTDYMSFTITSYKNGRISGNFSGQLTPLITAGNPVNTYGPRGSVLITNGSFQNVPVLY